MPPPSPPALDAALPYGLSPDGRLMHVTEVPAGLACWCRCPRCGDPLVARKGAIVAPHFAHAGQRACRAAWETTLHRLAKEVIRGAREVLLPEAAAEPGGGLPREVLAPAAPFRFDAVETEVALGGLRPDALLRRAGRMLAMEFAVTHFCADEKRAELRRRGLACVEVDLSGVPRLATRDEHARAILYEAPRRWLSNARVERVEERLRAAAQARLAAEQARQARRHTQLIPAVVSAWSVPPRPGDPVRAAWARDAGLAAVVGVAVAGGEVFAVDPTTWQAALLRLLCAAAPSSSGRGPRFDAVWALDGLRRSGMLKGPFAATDVTWDDADLLAQLRAQLEGFRPPAEVVAAYCAHLVDRGVLAPVAVAAGGGCGWRPDPGWLRETRARLAAVRATRAREREILARVTMLLAAAGLGTDPGAALPEGWMDRPLAGLGASPATIARAGGGAYETLLRRLGALARMAHPGGEPVRTGLLGLPLAEINRVRAAEARARDQQRRRRLAAAAAKPWTSAAP